MERDQTLKDIQLLENERARIAADLHDDLGSLISAITVSALTDIAATFESGMAPKVAACINAINSGAKSARIIDGKSDAAFIAALSHSGGTLVTA